MRVYKISANLYVAGDPNFGDFDKDIVFRLLQQVQIDFSNWIGTSVFLTSDCFIFYKDICPTIYSFGDNEHHIRLHVKGNDWWRWVYQFAHEYCHHLINGKMTGEISGLVWFEETICDLSAIFHLNRLIALCDVFQIDNLIQYKNYARACLVVNQGQAQDNCREYLKQHLNQLEEPVYHRDIYSNLSSTMFPLFEENNHLWKIISHFGDMRSWSSLEDLFVHLRNTADDSYSVSLNKLHDMLL